MEAKELMIGDWVVRQDKPIQIQFIYNDGYDDNVAEVEELDSPNLYEIEPYLTKKEITIQEIEPIPLTVEILEKNGWKEAQFWHEYQDGKNTIQSWLPDMRGIINGVEIQHFQCEYVHQYQHLLRLCGLNDLADNFKVD